MDLGIDPLKLLLLNSIIVNEEDPSENSSSWPLNWFELRSKFCKDGRVNREEFRIPLSWLCSKERDERFATPSL